MPKSNLGCDNTLLSCRLSSQENKQTFLNFVSGRYITVVITKHIFLWGKWSCMGWDCHPISVYVWFWCWMWLVCTLTPGSMALTSSQLMLCFAFLIRCTDSWCCRFWLYIQFPARGRSFTDSLLTLVLERYVIHHSKLSFQWKVSQAVTADDLLTS